VAQIARKNSVNAVQRVQDLEVSLARIDEAINKAFTQQQRQIDDLRMLARATAVMLGIEDVNLTIDNLKLSDDADRQTAQKQAVAHGLETGELTVQTEVVEGSALVLTQKSPAGEVLKLGSRVQLPWHQLKEEFRALVLGKKVGDTVAVPEGNLFEVAEIYAVTPKPEVAPAAPQTAPVQS
jgi:hypothetical protein